MLRRFCRASRMTGKKRRLLAFGIWVGLRAAVGLLVPRMRGTSGHRSLTFSAVIASSCVFCAGLIVPAVLVRNAATSVSGSFAEYPWSVRFCLKQARTEC